MDVRSEIEARMGDIEKRSASLREQQEGISKEREALFHEAARLVMKAHPLLGQFSWRQFTPYFNDGDACYFRVDEEYEAETVEGKDLWELPKAVYEPVAEDINSALGILNDDDCLRIFGDHSKVIVTRDGAGVYGYEGHD